MKGKADVRGGGKVGCKNWGGKPYLNGGPRAGYKRRTNEKASVAWYWKSIV